MERDQSPRRLAQPPAGAVADDGVADLLGGGEPDPGRAVGLVDAPARLRRQRRSAAAFAFLDVLEFGPLAQPRDGREGVAQAANP